MGPIDRCPCYGAAPALHFPGSCSSMGESLLKWDEAHTKANDGIGICPLGSWVVFVAVVSVIVVAVGVVIVISLLLLLFAVCRPAPTALGQWPCFLQFIAWLVYHGDVMVKLPLGHRCLGPTYGLLSHVPCGIQPCLCSTFCSVVGFGFSGSVF
ncbi:hypothetical protein Tco_1312691 [Tanacetum coccineum]